MKADSLTGKCVAPESRDLSSQVQRTFGLDENPVRKESQEDFYLLGTPPTGGRDDQYSSHEQCSENSRLAQPTLPSCAPLPRRGMVVLGVLGGYPLGKRLTGDRDNQYPLAHDMREMPDLPMGSIHF